MIGCDGIRSAIRRVLCPAEGGVAFGGINLWRGVTIGKPVLDGRSAIRLGRIATGKLVLYPIREYPDGTQMLNWAAEVLMDVRKENGGEAGPYRVSSAISRNRNSTGSTCLAFTKAEMILEYRWSIATPSIAGPSAA